uniref:Uncharacterized protein n=1 Tax=Rhizophora mucronata TaxID=61149 RepID=A0A2P2R257_RHIMU
MEKGRKKLIATRSQNHRHILLEKPA